MKVTYRRAGKLSRGVVISTTGDSYSIRDDFTKSVVTVPQTEVNTIRSYDPLGSVREKRNDGKN